MNENISCWRCGAVLAVELFPLQREEVCDDCDADLHVCKQCEFYNPTVSDGCDEPIALSVSNKERANFCDYLKPSVSAFRPRLTSADGESHAALNELFGGDTTYGTTANVDTNRAALDRLFGLDDD